MRDALGIAAYLACQEKLKGHVKRIVHSEAEAEDVLQDTFLRWFEMEGSDRVKSPASFLFAIAHNLALDRLRRAKVRVAISHSTCENVADIYADGLSPESAVIAQQELGLLMAAVTQLPPQCQRVFIMHRVYGLSYAEIGRALGISQSTARSHIGNALHACQRFMNRIHA